MKMLRDWRTIAAIVLFLGFVGWWASFQMVVTQQGTAVQWFGGTYGLMALFGAVVGLFVAQKWGGVKSILGRALTLFSLGLLAQEAGQLIYTYYVYGAKIAIPYPSFGDVAYFGSVLLYIAAAFYLARAAGTKFSLRSTMYKLVAVVVPVVLLGASYFIFLYGHQYDFAHPLTAFLDFGYPMGQALYIAVAITAYLLSRKMLGGIMKSGIILVILALFIQYIADFTFVYQSNRGTYLAGSFDDLFYLIAYFAMTMAMVKFHVIHDALRKPQASPAATPEGS